MQTKSLAEWKKTRRNAFVRATKWNIAQIKILRRPSKNVISKSMRRHIYQNPNRNDAILRASALAQLSSTLTLVMLNHTVSECVPVPKRTTKQKMHVGFRISSRMPCVCVLSCSFCYS